MTRPARTVREVLIAARYILDRWGWCKGALDGLGRRCSVTAVFTVRCMPGLKSEAVQMLGGVTPTIRFNDAPSTTLPMVLARFDEAIARAK